MGEVLPAAHRHVVVGSLQLLQQRDVCSGFRVGRRNTGNILTPNPASTHATENSNAHTAPSRKKLTMTLHHDVSGKRARSQRQKKVWRTGKNEELKE